MLNLTHLYQPLLFRYVVILALALAILPVGVASVIPTDAGAQLRLGEQYAFGQGVTKDEHKAVELFRLAAEQGNAEAQYKLAWMLEKGRGTEKNEEEAFTWYQMAAKQGHGNAINNIGGMYDDGRGTKADPQAAAEWYRKAADLGLAHGHYNLAILYMDGKGVEKDLEAARKHFQIAKTEGVRGAENKLMEVDRLLAIAAAGSREVCGPTPAHYQGQSYGDLLYALDQGCMRTLDAREQTFTVGMSQFFLENCDFPRNPEKRDQLRNFLIGSVLTVTGGRQYSHPNPLMAVADQLENTALFGLGVKTAGAIGCTDTGDHLADNVVAYLYQTALGSADGPSYVDSCATHYAGQYSRAQCECLANIGRSVFPNIHSQAFSQSSIKSILQSNPLLGFQIMLQCRMVDY